MSAPKALYLLRDDLADALGIGSIEAHDAPLRFLLNRFLIDAQNTIYWDHYRWAVLRCWWQISTVAGVSKYAYPGGLAAPNWAANTPYNQNMLVKDTNGNTQECTQTGASGAIAPAWSVVVNGVTVDNGAVWICRGVYTEPAIEFRMIQRVSLIYNNQWLDMVEGIDPRDYTLTSQMYPQRYAHRAGPLFEVWPVPSGVWQVMIDGYQALNAFKEDADLPTLDTDLVFLKAVMLAKAHPKFMQKDVGVYSKMFTDLQRSLQAASHGNRRYIPGERSGLQTRAQPILGNPQPPGP